MIQFTKDCMIGIPQIDKEHEYLFSLVNRAYEAEAGNKEELEEILLKLKDYAKEHFAHEEAYMETIRDPELPMQRREHRDFTEKVGAWLDEVRTLTGEEAKEQKKAMLEFLTRWLYHHILSSDNMIGKSIVATEANPYAFVQQYHTGIGMIDEEHQQLFAIIRKTDEVIHAELLHDKYDEIMNILDELRQYTEKHFRDEEAYMEQIGYPELEIQKITHEAFIEKLVQIDLEELETMDDNQQEYLESLLDFLAGWLVNHIMHMDKKIAEYEHK